MTLEDLNWNNVKVLMILDMTGHTHRDGKSAKRGKRACAIFSPSCANFWPVYAQNLLLA